MLMNKTLAIFVALTLVVSAVSIALVADDAQAGKNRNNNKPPKVRGDNGAQAEVMATTVVLDKWRRWHEWK